MSRSTLPLVLALSALAFGCNKDKAAEGTSPAPSSTASSTSATAEKAAATTTKTAEPASAAAAFPATALPAKKLADYTIGVPPGGKVDKSGDNASLETPDYKLMIKPGGKNDLGEMKGAVKSMPGFKAFTIDQPDGVVVEAEEKGAPQFMLTRYVKVGDTTISCESALTKPPKDKTKAKEAFDVCGTIKKK